MAADLDGSKEGAHLDAANFAKTVNACGAMVLVCMVV